MGSLFLSTLNKHKAQVSYELAASFSFLGDSVNNDKGISYVADNEAG